MASEKRLTCGIKWEHFIEKLGMINVRLVEENGEKGEDLASNFLLNNLNFGELHISP